MKKNYLPKARNQIARPNTIRDINKQIVLNYVRDRAPISRAELWFGEERNIKDRNFITVLVTEGIGTGIIFDGRVYRGDRGAAGEFGHMIVSENAPVECSCGGRSCWEAHASEKAIRFRYQNQVKKRLPKNGDYRIEQLIKLANEGDEEAVRVFKEAARFLGIGISNLIVGFSPQAIIVSGKIVKVWDLIKDEITHLASRSVRQELPQTIIRASSLGDSPTLTGALSLVLARKFASAN